MEFRKAVEADLDIIKGLYEGSFPVEERRPWDDFAARALDGNPYFNVSVAQKDGRIVGFISTWRLPTALYVEHFAVDSAMRGQGIGGEMIDRLVASTTLPLILEVEHPDNEMARRRIDFYRRHGFSVVEEVDYVPPPYGRNLPEVPMLLMSTRALEDVDTDIRLLHQIVYNQ
ncbi:MAG: GNAT family N-acetyltransferase [Muribaculaceae bacterium]|nr:GNAT family N-acetyltransferase [Muribaculaceae bacterium]